MRFSYFKTKKTKEQNKENKTKKKEQNKQKQQTTSLATLFISSISFSLLPQKPPQNIPAVSLACHFTESPDIVATEFEGKTKVSQ